MNEALTALQITVVLSFMVYASWSDIKTREVSNKVWAFLGPVGLAFTLINIHFSGSYSKLNDLALSFMITTGIAVALFYLGFFGGADAKALICLSLALPYNPTDGFTPVFSFIPFPLSVFANAILSSILIAFYALLRNVLWVASGKSLFEGLESESLAKKFMSLITGYKVKVSDLKEKFYLYPIEKIEQTQEGKVTKKLQVLVHAEADREADVAKIAELSRSGLVSEVWATPGLPFLFFITVGLILTLLFGDVIFWLISLLCKI
jgi:preflagellin peptidase FlaK